MMSEEVRRKYEIFGGDQVHRVHEISKETKTVVLVRCWSVIFDVNGNAPANATVASFATEELANQALRILSQNSAIAIGGQEHYGFPDPYVEGYEHDTSWKVAEDWQPREQVLVSLAQMADEMADEQAETDLPEGAWLLPEDEDSEDEDGADD